MRCKICDKPLSSNRELRSHLKAEHGMSPPTYFEEHPDATKYCSKCKNELPITQFFSDKSNTFGFRTRCVSCMRPEGKKRECPICHRIFQWSAIITHLRDEHGISPVDGYQEYLKGKYCPKCKTVKPLDDFSRLADENQVYQSWCKTCNVDRNVERAIRD